MSAPQTPGPQTSESPKFRFTLRFMFILTFVVAASGVSLSFFVKALYTQDPTTEIGTFAIVAAMTPTLFLVMASWLLRIFGRWLG